jgi:hypothetical protein
MTMRHSLLSFFVLALACGGSSSNDAGGPPPDTAGGETPALVGRWAAPCTPNDTGAFTLDFDLTETRWSLDYDTFGDAGCASPLLTVHIEGPYEITGPSEVAGAREARFAFDAKTITAHSDAAVAFLGGFGEACGGPGTWSVDVARDVGASGCAPLGQRPIAECPADFDLVSVTSTELRFGARPADNDLCTPERRPTALSGLASLRR